MFKNAVKYVDDFVNTFYNFLCLSRIKKKPVYKKTFVILDR